MMCKTCILILLILAISTCPDQINAEEDTTSLRAEFIKEIDMNQGSLSRGLGALMQIFSPDSRESRSFLKDVRQIKMAVYETGHLNNENRELGYLLDDLETEGWDRVIHVREQEEQVWILMRRWGKLEKDIYIVSINPDHMIEVREDPAPDQMIAQVLNQSSRWRSWDDDDEYHRTRNKRRSKYHYRPRMRRYLALDERYMDGFDNIHIRYNRVDGGYIGFREQGEYRGNFGITPFGEGGYAFSSKKWQYQAGGELYRFLGRRQILSAGFEIHDRTETQDAWLIGENENSVSSALLRDDFRDYYRRRGWSTFGAYNIYNHVFLMGQFQQDKFASLSNTVNWSLFENKYANDTFRRNPSIDQGRINSVRIGIRLDTRNSRSHPQRGWLVSGLVERAGGTFGGDYAFDRYILDARRYQSLWQDMRFDIRIRLGAADGTLPHQYLYDLGGVSSLRGYEYKSFTGDRTVLLNAEYWLDGDLWHHKWPMEMFSIGAFFDAGSAWFSQTPAALTADQTGSGGILLKPNLLTSAGVGVKAAGIRAYFARQIASPNKDWQVSFQINRSF